jgi:hypothetical protein
MSVTLLTYATGNSRSKRRLKNHEGKVAFAP